MLGFGSKVLCSDLIASQAADVFSGMKDKLQKGIDEITTNREGREKVRNDLKLQLNAVEAEIAKDTKNIDDLKAKQIALSEII